MTIGYYIRDALRWVVMVFIAVACGAGLSILLSLTGLIGDVLGFLAMPTFTAIIAILLDRNLPETKA